MESKSLLDFIRESNRQGTGGFRVFDGRGKRKDGEIKEQIRDDVLSCRAKSRRDNTSSLKGKSEQNRI